MRYLPWTVLAMLCCTSSKHATDRAISAGQTELGGAAGAGAQDAGVDPRLVEAQVIFEEAKKLRVAGKYAEALAAAERAISIREALLGQMHPEVADCLSFAGDAARLNGEFGRAEPHITRALNIRERRLGKDHPQVADSLNDLANVYHAQGLYDRAEPLYYRAISIWESAFGKDHSDVARSLNGLAVLYERQGMYGRAEQLHLRAIAIKELALGKDHPDLAISLNNLAFLHERQGLYNRAEQLHLRAIAIRELALGKDHPDLATSFNNLAIIYFQQGLYGRAEPLCRRALVIRESALGKGHPDVASSLNVLAAIYYSQGLFERAEPLYQRALAIWESVLGNDHPDVAGLLHNLASLYYDQGLYDRAETLYRRALAISEAAHGRDHPQVAASLNSLASLQGHLGRYGEAESLHQRAMAIWEATAGKDHPYLADSLSRLASLYQAQGLYSRAEPLHQRALTIREAALGQQHPSVAYSWEDIGQLRLAQGRLGASVALLTRAFVVSEGRLRREALDFSESRLREFLGYLRTSEERLYALLRAHPANAEVRRLVLAATLLLKGRSVEETANVSQAIYRSLGAQDRDAFERLRGLRTQLAKLSLDGPGQLAPAEYRQHLKKLADEGDAIEADLAKRSAPLRALTALPLPDEILRRVASAIPRDGVLVQFVAYTDRPLVPQPGTPLSKLPAQPRYLAMVLFPDGQTGAVDLGPAAAIDMAASRLRDALANQDARFQVAAQKLYQLAVKPLLPLLGNTRRLLLSPDGQLALVPFAALHDGRRFLADTFDFSYLTSGRDLLPRPDDIPHPSSIVILADPDYSTKTPAPDGGVTLAATERSYPVERFFTEHRAGLSEQQWGALPGTRQEAEAIHRLLPQAQLLVGTDASKEQLLRLRAPGILHVATHGFFLDDSTTASGARGVSEVGPVGGGSIPRAPDPLLRSGLVLSGAATTANLSNSLVTALELAGLDLWGTQLVVLSACDTGRGDVKRGQGVYGLRRALVVAGAEAVVVSLWKVNDLVTRDLMESYYRNLLAGRGRIAALREAMLALREQHPHPHYWAPFIGIGSDAPLRQLAPASEAP